MSSSSLPPPGWYGDPSGEHGSRWWDGQAWTDHVRAGAPNDDPPPPPGGLSGSPTPDAQPVSPLSMSRRGRATAVVASVVVLVGLVAATAVGLGFGRGPAPSGPLDPDEVASRADAAGCRVTAAGDPMEDRDHLDPGDAPPPDVLYPQRPAHSGPHFGGVLPLPGGAADDPIDERAVLHNMEHGAVVVWFDRAAVPGREREQIADWRDSRHDLGFTSRAGGAVFASPMPPIEDAPAVALRAWGVALDCERFDPMVADAFLVDHWGTHGAAPEADLSPYPDGTLRFAVPR